MPTNSKSRPLLVARIRERLFRELGNACAEADDNCDGPLQIDHPFGRDYKPHKLSNYNRWLRYQKEHEASLIRLLCSYHNQTIRPKPQLKNTNANTPF